MRNKQGRTTTEKKPTHFSGLEAFMDHLRFLSFCCPPLSNFSQNEFGARKPTPTPNFWVFGDRLANHTNGDSPLTDKEWPKSLAVIR
jgi:hypothetical protein